MGLQAESPAWVIQAVLERQAGIALPLRTIHWLQEKFLKIELSEQLRLRTGLGKNKFEFPALPESEGRAGLGADTDPVDARWRKQCAIGLNSNLKPLGVQGLNKDGIKLEQGFTACTHDKRNTVRSRLSRPGGSDRPSQVAGGRETPAPGAVRPNEIGIAELTHSRRAVLFQSGP